MRPVKVEGAFQVLDIDMIETKKRNKKGYFLISLY